ncbi:hypothetical protein HN51_022565, partial [Arachis hypogaea]
SHCISKFKNTPPLSDLSPSVSPSARTEALYYHQSKHRNFACDANRGTVGRDFSSVRENRNSIRLHNYSSWVDVVS